MEKYIFDTNIFFNMQAGLGLGEKTEDVILSLTKKSLILKKEKKAEFLMPPRAVEEFLGFFENKNQAFIKNFLSSITIKSPVAAGVVFPSSVFYKLIEDIRARSYRGLSIGEEEIISSANGMVGQHEMSKKDFQIKTGQFIKKFRERYRNATRTGFLDSLADLDLIVLSIEQNGFLVSSDKGVLEWGRVFGVREMPCAAFRKRLEDLLG